jgi:hypothetical protein
MDENELGPRAFHLTSRALVSSIAEGYIMLTAGMNTTFTQSSFFSLNFLQKSGPA